MSAKKPGKAFKGRPTPEELTSAVDYNNKELVLRLLENGANINAPDKDGYTPLYGAVMRNSNDMVSLLVERGADINARNRDGMTAVMLAAGWDNIEIVQLLISKGANIRIKSDVGLTANAMAELKKIPRMLEFLKGALERDDLWRTEQKKAAAENKQKSIQAAVVLQHDLRRPKLRLRRKP